MACHLYLTQPNTVNRVSFHFSNTTNIQFSYLHIITFTHLFISIQIINTFIMYIPIQSISINYNFNSLSKCQNVHLNHLPYALIQNTTINNYVRFIEIQTVDFELFDVDFILPLFSRGFWYDVSYRIKIIKIRQYNTIQFHIKYFNFYSIFA
ncbi:hypothetical protein V6Z11_D06G148600 [Gossypium hirsutum]